MQQGNQHIANAMVKYDQGESVLDKERQEKKITMSKSFFDEEYAKYLTRVIENIRSEIEAIDDNNDRKRFDLMMQEKFYRKQLLRNDIQNIRQDIQKRWETDFIRWLSGRSEQNVVPTTPWGNKSLLHIPGVKEFISKPLTLRANVLKELTTLKMATPSNLNEAFIYYKYLVMKEGLTDDGLVKDFPEYGYWDLPPAIQNKYINQGKYGIPITEEVQQDVLDDEGNPILDEEGNPIKQMVFQKTTAPVKDLSQYYPDGKTPTNVVPGNTAVPPWWDKNYETARKIWDDNVHTKNPDWPLDFLAWHFDKLWNKTYVKSLEKRLAYENYTHGHQPFSREGINQQTPIDEYGLQSPEGEDGSGTEEEFYDIDEEDVPVINKTTDAERFIINSFNKFYEYIQNQNYLSGTATMYQDSMKELVNMIRHVNFDESAIAQVYSMWLNFGDEYKDSTKIPMPEEIVNYFHDKNPDEIIAITGHFLEVFTDNLFFDITEYVDEGRLEKAYELLPQLRLTQMNEKFVKGAINQLFDSVTKKKNEIRKPLPIINPNAQFNYQPQQDKESENLREKKTQYDELLKKYTDIKSQHEKITKELNEVTQEKNQLQERNTEETAQLANYQEKYNKLVDKYTALSNEQTKLDEELKTRQRELNVAHDLITQLEGSVQRNRQRVQKVFEGARKYGLPQNIQDVDYDISNFYDEKIKVLKTQINLTQTEYKNASEKLKKLEALNVMSKENEKELANLKQQMTQKETLNTKLSNDIKLLQSDKQKLLKEVAAFQENENKQIEVYKEKNLQLAKQNMINQLNINMGLLKNYFIGRDDIGSNIKSFIISKMDEWIHEIQKNIEKQKDENAVAISGDITTQFARKLREVFDLVAKDFRNIPVQQLAIDLPGFTNIEVESFISQIQNKQELKAIEAADYGKLATEFNYYKEEKRAEIATLERQIEVIENKSRQSLTQIKEVFKNIKFKDRDTAHDMATKIKEKLEKDRNKEIEQKQREMEKLQIELEENKKKTEYYSNLSSTSSLQIRNTYTLMEEYFESQEQISQEYKNILLELVKMKQPIDTIFIAYTKAQGKAYSKEVKNAFETVKKTPSKGNVANFFTAIDSTPRIGKQKKNIFEETPLRASRSETREQINTRGQSPSLIIHDPEKQQEKMEKINERYVVNDAIIGEIVDKFKIEKGILDSVSNDRRGADAMFTKAYDKHSALIKLAGYLIRNNASFRRVSSADTKERSQYADTFDAFQLTEEDVIKTAQRLSKESKNLTKEEMENRHNILMGIKNKKRFD